MHALLSHVAHRPWPVPTGPWRWRQSWCDLLFAHWPVPTERVRALVPPELSIHEYEGRTYIAIVPFHMEGVSARPLPDVPGLSAFPELNVRVYVEHDGKPGVWFISLDATNPFAVWAARRLFHLPYYLAQMSIRPSSDGFEYDSHRTGHAGAATFRGWYAPTSEPAQAAPGSLEHWLTERYCLYAQAPTGELYRAEVHHLPWPLQRATLQIERNTMASGLGIELDGEPPLLHFAKRLDVLVWNPVPLS